MLQPLGNMKEDHDLPSLVPAKRLSFSSLFETNYREFFFFFFFCQCVDMLANKWINASNENILPYKKNIFVHNINRPMLQV